VSGNQPEQKGEVTPAVSGPTLRGCATFRRIDAELQSVAALRRAARERGGPLPWIDVADTLLYERSRLREGSILTRPPCVRLPPTL
jgi:hypothetical protein